MSLNPIVTYPDGTRLVSMEKVRSLPSMEELRAQMLQAYKDKEAQRQKSSDSFTPTQKILKELESNRELLGAAPNGKVGDNISAFEAARSLSDNGKIYVSIPEVSPAKSLRWPQGHEIAGCPTSLYHVTVPSEGMDYFWDNNTAPRRCEEVSSENDLARLNAVEGLTSVDSSAALTPEEKTASQVLRKYEGTSHMDLSHVLNRWGGKITSYHYRSDPSTSEPGLYCDKPSGIFGHSHKRVRITAYEGLNRLQEQLPVNIYDGTSTTEVHSLKELSDFGQFSSR